MNLFRHKNDLKPTSRLLTNYFYTHNTIIFFRRSLILNSRDMSITNSRIVGHVLGISLHMYFLFLLIL